MARLIISFQKPKTKQKAEETKEKEVMGDGRHGTACSAARRGGSGRFLGRKKETEKERQREKGCEKVDE